MLPLETNRIYQKDCLEGMRELPTHSVDLVVTSPPYNLRNSTGGGMRNGSGGLWEGARLLNGYEGYEDDMPRDAYVAWQRQCLEEMCRVVKPEGAIFYNHKWRVQGGLLEDQHEIVQGFPVRQIIIWQRAGGINFNLGYFLPTYEVIYLICRDEFRLASKDPQHPKAACAVGDVWSIPQDSNNPHPAPFPIEIPLRCIEATDAKVVLDPFMGSGTTAIAAEILGREWIGFEVSEEYVAQAQERMTNLRSHSEDYNEYLNQRSVANKIHKLKRELAAAESRLRESNSPTLEELFSVLTE